MVGRITTTALCTGLFALATMAQPAWAECGPALAHRVDGSTPKRPINAADIIQLRYVGDPESAAFATPSPFGVSPDGKHIAYIVTRADLATNSYCRTLVTSPVEGDTPPRVLDRGGQIILITDHRRGYAISTGAPRVIVPRWSPDGRHIAYLRRDHDRIQAWVANADGSGARMLSHAPVDVYAIAWSGDGTRLLYATPHRALAEQEAVDKEGKHGWLYDERVSPDVSARPAAQAQDALDVYSVDLATGQTEKAWGEDVYSLTRAAALLDPHDPWAIGNDGSKATVDRTAPSPLSPKRLVIISPGGLKQPCKSASCSGDIIAIWWLGDTVLYLKRQGWDKEDEGLYRWTPGSDEPAQLMVTSDVLHGCELAQSDLICTSETSTTPRVIVAIDVASGERRELLDLNPEFANIALGRVTRLRYRNDIGLESWADLVLPPGYRPGTKLPLVVVQYHSLGFLQGGTGNEYPIYLLARHGFAVLSLERPTFYGSLFPDLKDWNAIITVGEHDWHERRSLLSSIMTGVRQAENTGAIDPARIGITGLSDGGTSVEFALLNTRAFAAAATSTCCYGPYTIGIYGGIAWARQMQSFGYPKATTDAPDFWRPMSFAQNAARMNTPLLMQLSDNEFRLALEGFGALHDHGQPVEMVVYPDEFHIRWQPIHRQATFERDIDWFAFWLQGREDPDPAKRAQYRRWNAMREKSGKKALPSNQP